MTNQDLVEAVQYGECEEVRCAMEEGLDPNYCDDESGYTLLHWAAQEEQVDIIKLLVKSGANVERCDQNDVTALYNAAGDGNLEVVKTLVMYGANVNNVQKSGAALHNACAYGHKHIVEFLIDSGADVNAVDDDGISPLQFAISNSHHEIADLLIAKGAQKYVSNSDRMPHSIAISNAVMARYDAVGLENLSPAEQVLACVLTLKFAVESHGFDGYYVSPASKHAEETPRALEQIGAKHSAELLRQANACLKDDSHLMSRDINIPSLLGDEASQGKLDDITSEFYDDKDNLRELIGKFIEANRNQLPDL